MHLSVRRLTCRTILGLVLAIGLMGPLAFSNPIPFSQSGSSGDAAAPNNTSEGATQLKKSIQDELNRIQELENRVNSIQAGSGNDQAVDQLRQQIQAERERVEKLEQRLKELESHESQSQDSQGKVNAGRGKEQTPGITTGLAPADIYNNGFYVSSADKSFSMYVNGLFQTRFTYFGPQQNVTQFGASAGSVNNFDVYLGRLAVSGSAFDPSLKYFMQFQGSTAGNGNNETLLDWFTSKTFSKYLTVQVGRSWTPYTYEYYDNPGNYLFADLSTAEFAFVLPRAIGLEAYGQVGRLSYAGEIANGIPALDAPGQENFNSRVAYIGHIHYDILAPYGYIETDPSPHGAPKPELTLWGSVAYNPVIGSSSFENAVTGDRTVNATSTLGFRYQYFTLQGTGYYRRTTQVVTGLKFDSWGYGEQAGYYLLPGRIEIAERLSGVNWGAPNFMPTDFTINTWYSGPNFPYHNITEHSLGLNYYLHGHNAKVQVSYSYLNGDTFSRETFGANRVWAQAEIMF